MTSAKITISFEELKQFHQQLGGKSLKIAKECQRLYKGRQYPSNPYPCLDSWKDSKANDLTKAIITFLRLFGYQAERVRSEGRAIDDTKTFIDVVGRQRTVGGVRYIKSTSTNGTADISSTIEGLSVKIEVKVGKDKQSADQRKYQEDVEAAGGVYFIAKDFQSFYEWFIKFVYRIKQFRNDVGLN